jgi:NAD(P)-dependent dehydrogenase (short-subunit alcohol dehydrogenase family)
MARVLVTGAASGLGLNAATDLATGGHDVVVHVRDRTRRPGEPAGRGWADVVTGDLSDLAQIAGVAEQANACGPFDAVIHNAGVMEPHDVLAVNVLAPYLLTTLLEPPERQVFLSSSMHRGGSTDLRRATSGRLSYSDTKLWVTALSRELADLRPATASHAVDPGWVPTRMGGPGAPDDLRAGHETQVWLSTAVDVEPATGGYWHHRRTQRPHPAVEDASFRAALVDELARLTGVTLDDYARPTRGATAGDPTPETLDLP